MLNISETPIKGKIDSDRYRALSSFNDLKSKRKRNRIIIGVSLVALCTLFLPWTQNIRSRGLVTSLQPEKRPQALVSVISGRIDKWYVQEGTYVNQGDTIIRITEIKDEYFDPLLLERTASQIEAKRFSVGSYESKVAALENQIEALRANQLLKLEQARNKLRQADLKVTADSIDLEAARINYNIAEAQFERYEKLYAEGLQSKTDLEQRRMKMQEALAKQISQESKLLSSRNDVLNAQVELNSINAEYRDKIAKAESEKFATLSSKFDAEASVTKLENQLSNYEIRRGNYYITAPQDGYVTRAVQTGIGQTIKEGETIITLMPAGFKLAVEMYVRPLDLPLIHVGEHVRIQFDGWPAIIFSGWPGVSTGTFGGEVVAIDNFTSENGLYRVLVAHDPDDPDWPEDLRVGAGANSFALLNDVPVWYELWRQINGFPPDYYTVEDRAAKASKSSANAKK